MKKILFAFAALIVVSCIEEGNIQPAVEKVPVSVGISETKTAISDRQISFSGGESMSLVCEASAIVKLSVLTLSVSLRLSYRKLTFSNCIFTQNPPYTNVINTKKTTAITSSI